MNEKINISIRGAGGLLGHRLLRKVLSTQPDIDVNSVIVGTDLHSLRRLERVLKSSSIPIFIDAKRKKVRELAQSVDPSLNIQALDQVNGTLNRTDAIVDAAILKKNDPLKQYLEEQYKGKIIYQSGTHPHHVPIAPPFEPNASDRNDFRQGDCLISGIAPVLHTIRENITNVDLALVVQRQTPLRDYTLRDNLDDIIVNPDLAEYVNTVVADLLELEQSAISATVFESPGHDYYLCRMKLKLSESIDKDEFVNRLKHQPRVKLAPSSIPVSTGQLSQRLREEYIESGKELEPIICFTGPGAIEVRGKEVILHIAIYSKAITVLPNIDAIRGLVRKIPLIESMRQTDENLGFGE